MNLEEKDGKSAGEKVWADTTAVEAAIAINAQSSTRRAILELSADLKTSGVAQRLKTFRRPQNQHRGQSPQSTL